MDSLASAEPLDLLIPGRHGGGLPAARRRINDIRVRSPGALFSLALAAAAAFHAGEARAQPAGRPAGESAGTGRGRRRPAQPRPNRRRPRFPSGRPRRPRGIEVTVEGNRAPPGSVSLTRRDVRELPGALGDPYRAIEIQPGVTAIASGMPYYYIRGAPPGNIGYFFNGIQVPLLFHVGAGPSVIPAAMVQRVEMHLGPYPADIGRLAGAAIEAESAPPSDVWRGEGSLRFVDLGGVVEGPMDRDTHVLVGGHYAAGAALTSALVPSVDVGYADYQGRMTYRLGPEERFTVFAFGAYDYLASIGEEDGAEVTDVLLDSDFHRLDLRYDRDDAASGARVRSALTLGLDRSRGVGVESAEAWKLNARISLARPILAGRALLRVGVDAAVDRYVVTPRPSASDGEAEGGASTEEDTPAEGTAQLDESFPELFRSRLDLALGAWADALLVLDERSTLTPGVRVDHYTSLGKSALAVDPRIVGRFGVGDHVRLIPAFGLASQLPGLAPLPALQIGGIPGGCSAACRSSFGVEADAGPVNFSATVFRQVTFGLSDPIGTGRGTTSARSASSRGASATRTVWSWGRAGRSAATCSSWRRTRCRAPRARGASRRSPPPTTGRTWRTSRCSTTSARAGAPGSATSSTPASPPTRPPRAAPARASGSHRAVLPARHAPVEALGAGRAELPRARARRAERDAGEGGVRRELR